MRIESDVQIAAFAFSIKYVDNCREKQCRDFQAAISTLRLLTIKLKGKKNQAVAETAPGGWSILVLMTVRVIQNLSVYARARRPFSISF